MALRNQNFKTGKLPQPSDLTNVLRRDSGLNLKKDSVILPKIISFNQQISSATVAVSQTHGKTGELYLPVSYSSNEATNNLYKKFSESAGFKEAVPTVDAEPDQPTSLSEVWKQYQVKHNIDFDVTSVRTEVVQGTQLTEHETITLAKNYREYFGYDLGGAWREYLKCTHPECARIVSVQEAYGLQQDEYYPLAFLEEHKEVSLVCSDHPDRGPMVYFHQIDKLVSSFRKKLKENSDSIVSMLRDKKEEIVGYAAFYKTTVGNAWSFEFADVHDKVRDEYIESLGNLLGQHIDEHSPICVLNLVGINTPYRSAMNTHHLLTLIRNNIPENCMDLPVVCEMDITNPFTAFLVGMGAQIIHKGDSITSNYTSQLALVNPTARIMIDSFNRYHANDPEMIQRATKFRKMQKEGKLGRSVSS